MNRRLKERRCAEAGEWRDQTTADERAFLKYVLGTRATIPLVGRVFGRLFVVRECIYRKGKYPLFLVECQCPKRKRLYVRGDSLRIGRTVSCGCLSRELAKLPPAQRMRGWSEKELARVFAAKSRFLQYVTAGAQSTKCSADFGPCLDWSGTLSRDGYAAFSLGGRTVRASHCAWFYAHGWMPSSPLNHVCDRRQCVRPSHLFEGFAGAALYDRHLKAKGAVLVVACTEPIGQEQAQETL